MLDFAKRCKIDDFFKQNSILSDMKNYRYVTVTSLSHQIQNTCTLIINENEHYQR